MPNPLSALALLARIATTLLIASTAIGQDTKDWTWRDVDGKTKMRGELDQIIQKHDAWLAGRDPFLILNSELSDPKRANLRGADLRDANLRNTNLNYADLRGAKLARADLRGASLRYADLRGADLSGAYLKDARLSSAHLDDANVLDADLSGAEISDVTLANATFEPKSISNATGFVSPLGLELVLYDTKPFALADLRKSFKDGGFRDEERKITYALKRGEAELGGPINYLFNRIFFDLTCQYGMNPGRPLKLMVALWLFCSLVYLLFFIHLSKRSGLYLIPSPEFGRDQKEHATSPQRIRWQHGYSRGLGSKVLQELCLLRTAMFFSLMSAFNIGFRDINFGRWLRLLTKREYDIKAVGWARPVSGLQSLLSVYFIALWVLTYFGRPFE